MSETSRHVRIWRRARILLMLLCFAYLGFYVYGLILGIFSPAAMIGASVAAMAMIVGIGAVTVRWKLGFADPEDLAELEREGNMQRERRGF